MAIVSSTVGCETKTGWKRRSRAGSFSMRFRYSSSVVAPMQRSSPRASAGFSRLAASIDPSAAPAPTIVWSSSMKNTICPCDVSTSLSTAFSLSSNSPRYLEPATSAPMSSAHSRLFFSDSGTSPRTMRCAMPSTMAVLPTPGSPMSTGLFFVRRDSTCITRRISSSRPTTGSIFPFRAASVRSRVYFSRAWNFPSGSWSVIRCDLAHAGQRREQLLVSDPAVLLEKRLNLAVVSGHREDVVLDRHELVLQALCLVIRLSDDFQSATRQPRFGPARHLRVSLEALRKRLSQPRHVLPGLLEHRCAPTPPS